MKIALVPLDERPANTRYPRMIGAIAGASVLLPPAQILSHYRQGADRDALADWLAAESRAADHRIVSIETLAYGGLIASRTSHDAPAQVQHYLARLEALPRLPTFAFNVITRISNANDAVEEPAYWATHGRDLYRYSQLHHQQQAGQEVAAALQALRARLPQAALHDFVQRRLRNHRINLDLVEMAAHDVLDLLVLSSDDTSEYGFGSQEKAWLKTWAARLELGDDRLLMYPGADEVGCVLLIRALLQGRKPTFYIHYAIDEDRHLVAPYEDSPIAVTVERQIRALGGQMVNDLESAEFIVAVNTPSRIAQEYDANHPHFAADHARRAPHLQRFAGQVETWVQAGRRVIVCDVAYPNGSDPDLIEHLLKTDLRRLAAYGAWNTAGNTVGVALAQGVATPGMASWADTPAAQAAQQRFLLHRFIEDWGYQHLVRQNVRDQLESQTGRRDTVPANQAETTARIHAELTALLPRLGALAAGWQIVNLTLPWNRTFEIDFDLERQP